MSVISVAGLNFNSTPSPNIAGGVAKQIPIQNAPSSTGFIDVPTGNAQTLQSTGVGNTPVWSNNIAVGSAQISSTANSITLAIGLDAFVFDFTTGEIKANGNVIAPTPPP